MLDLWIYFVNIPGKKNITKLKRTPVLHKPSSNPELSQTEGRKTIKINSPKDKALRTPIKVVLLTIVVLTNYLKFYWLANKAIKIPNK